MFSPYLRREGGRRTSLGIIQREPDNVKVQRMVRGYCVGSRQDDGLNKNLGSGTSQYQASDLKIETKIETKLLPLACSSADLTHGQKIITPQTKEQWG